MKWLSEKFAIRILIIGLVFFVIAIVLFLWRDSNFNINNSIDFEKVSYFGGFIGGVVGSIWALAGVVLFYVALKEQRKEFNLQLEELKSTKEIYELQSNTLKIQQFESTFFNLINLLSVMRDKIEIDKTTYSSGVASNSKLQGEIALISIYENLKPTYFQNFSTGDSELINIKRTYHAFTQIFDNLNSYFKTLLNILEFCDNINISNKKIYYQLLKAQITSIESSFIFYHGLSGVDNLKYHIEKYGLLWNFPDLNLIIEDHKELYSSNAFIY